MSRIIALGLLFISLSANAAGPVVDTVVGASKTLFTGTNNLTVTIYGGLGGLACTPPSGVNTSTCDSCTGTYNTTDCTDSPLCPCNTARIWDGMVLQINIRADSANPYNIVAGNGSAATVTNINLATTPNRSYAQINWSDLCNAMGQGTCEGAKTNTTALSNFTLKLAFDKNADGQYTAGEETTDVTIRLISPEDSFGSLNTTNTSGIDAFTPYPGDEKIRLTELNAGGSFPTIPYASGSSKALAVRVYFSKVNLNNAVPHLAEYEQDLAVNLDNGEFSETPNVDGLDNDVPYYFRIGLIDEGGNSVQYFPDMTNVGAGCTSTPGDPTNCAFAATPSEVLGLLSENMNCFIATAAYGSTLDPHVNTFRAFRNAYLLTHKWGRSFVHTYYKYGPYAARYIADKPVLRSIARGALWPLYAFSYAALKFGFALTFAAALLILTSLYALPSYGIKRWRARV